MTTVMLVCYLLWARADLLLFAGPSRKQRVRDHHEPARSETI